MAEPKYRCPTCGCKRLYYAKETPIKKLYKLNPDGTPYKEHLCVIKNYSDSIEEYIECQQCESNVNLANSAELKKWENPEYMSAEVTK